MPAKKDLTGQRFGRLIVITENGKQNGKIVWKCQCDCGNIKNILGSQLTKKTNPTQSCGCLQKEKTREVNQSEDLTGKIYTYLTVISRKENSSKWICQCKCGNIIETTTNHLNSGHTKSCGCLQKEKNKQNIQNIVGNKYGLLTVLSLDTSSVAKNIKWICKCECGSIISVKGNNLISNNTQSCGCSKLSHGEIKIKQLLDEYNISYEMEKTFPGCINPKTNKPLRFDFYVNNSYLIEYDGIQHYQESFKNQKLEDTQYRDQIKNNWCKKHNIPLIRIPYTKYNDLNIMDLLISN